MRGNFPRFDIKILLVALAVLAPLPASAGVNDPQARLLFPRDGGSLRSDRVPLVMARFDRPLKQPSRLEVINRFGNPVPGVSRLNEPDDEPESWRAIEFIPTNPLSESASPFLARARACAFPANGCTTFEWDFEIDDTAPGVPTISFPLPGSLVTAHVVTVRGTAEPGAEIWVFEHPDTHTIIARDTADENGNYIVELPYPPEDGVEHSIKVAAHDEAGNTSPLTPQRTFRHDSLSFTPLITRPVQGQVLGTTSVTVEGRAKPNSTVNIRRNNTFITSTSSDSNGRFQKVIGLGNGSHTLAVDSFDGYLIDGPSPSVTFTVDTIAPGAPIFTLPINGSFVSGPSVMMAGTGEPNATIRIREGATVIGEASITASGSWQLSVQMTDGPKTVTGEVVDAGGNVSPTTANSFTVDSVAPVAPVIVTPADGSSLPTASVIFSGAAEANGTVVFVQNQTIIGSTTATGSGSFSTAIVFLDGTYTVRARVIDQAGNEGPFGQSVTFAVDTIVPAAPSIDQPLNGETLTAAPIFVSGTAEPNSGVIVYEGVTELARATTTTHGTWSMQVTVAAGPHTITATSTDRATNVSPASAPITFTFDPGPPDVTPPGVPTIQSPQPASFHPAFVVFAGFAEPGALVEIREGASVIATSNADISGSWETGRLMIDGSHSITARAKDKAGNTGPATPIVTFLVDGERPLVDTTSIDPAIVLPFEPVIVSGTATDDYRVARIEVEATNRLTSQRLGPFTAACPACPFAPVSWDATIALPPGLYRVEAFAVDHVGNRSKPDEIMVLRL
ncbi:MAG: Ig-like domain-containing protein [Actinomycetota bacterium]